MWIKKFIGSHIPSIKYGDSIKTELIGLINKTNKIETEFVNCIDKNEYLFWISQRKEGELLSETKKRVFLGLPKAEGELREIQLAELYILRKIKKICDNNGIQFFLMWGTLLGAVRHKGLIPWDDDIDIGMFRADYERLRELLSGDSELSIKRYYNTRELIKVKIKGFESIFIDIFLFEKIDIDTNINWQDKLIQYGNIYLKSLEEKTYKYLCKTKFGFDRMYSCEQIDSEMSEIKANIEKEMPFYGQGEYFCEVFERYDIHKQVLKIENSFPLVEVEFEGDNFFAFKDYDKFLEMRYGDIYRFPNKIFSHHLNEMTSDLRDEIQYLKINKKIL